MTDRLVLPLLLAACLVCGAILLIEIKRPARNEIAPAAPIERADPVANLRPLPTPPATPPLATILARPLFSPGRRPPHSNAGNDADNAGIGDARLAGIVVAPGHRFAIFAPTGAKPLVVTEGETISGWRVDSISPSEVSLTGPDGTKTVQPKFDPNLAPPPEPPSPAAPVVFSPPTMRAAPGVVVPQPGAPPFIPGQARLRQLRRR
jgi:hypothetical protein